LSSCAVASTFKDFAFLTFYNLCWSWCILDKRVRFNWWNLDAFRCL